MKNDQMIFYDDSCPMCKVYTKVFVASGALPANGRIGLAGAAELEPQWFSKLDLTRARHEIPLINRETGEIVYGTRAWGMLFAASVPALAGFFNHPLLHQALKPIYCLISYNRRSIAGCAPVAGFNCAPDVHVGWRLAYLTLTLGVWSLLLWPLWPVLLLQGLGLTWAAAKGWDALGSMATACLVFALIWGLLSPLGVLGSAVALGVFGLELYRRAWVWR
jgi:hypothetical protein